ncbi:MAG: TolC family protein [Candidatus Manganitrophaceae bacterium]
MRRHLSGGRSFPWAIWMACWGSILFWWPFFPLGHLIDACRAEAESPSLRLEAVLQQVAERNPEILAARERRQMAEERIPQARAFDDPEFGITQWSIPSNFSVGKADETWYSLSQRVPFFGKRDRRGRIAGLEREITDEEARGVERRVLAEAKRAYYDLFLADKTVSIHRKEVDLARKFSEIARAKFAVGESGQQDLIRAEVELLTLSNRHATLEQEREVAAARLNLLMNQPGSTPLGIPPVPAIPTVAFSLETLQKEAAEGRPQTRMEALAIRRGEEASQLAEWDRRPDFTAEISYWDVHRGPNRWMAGLRMTIPWVNKKRYEARIRESRAEQRRAEAGYQAAVNETEWRVRERFVRFQTSRRLVELYQGGILPLAEQSLEAAAVGYQTRKNDFLTLLEAQRNVRGLELTYFGALVEIWKSLAELEEMIGRELL